MKLRMQMYAVAHIRLLPLVIPFLVRFAHAKYQFSQRPLAFGQWLCKWGGLAYSALAIRYNLQA